MGIGAYDAQNFIQSLKGQLHVASTVNVGTTFTIELPINYNDNHTRTVE